MFLHPGSLASVQILEESQGTLHYEPCSLILGPEVGSTGVRKIEEVLWRTISPIIWQSSDSAAWLWKGEGYDGPRVKRCFPRCLLDRLLFLAPLPKYYRNGANKL